LVVTQNRFSFWPVRFRRASVESSGEQAAMTMIKMLIVPFIAGLLAGSAQAQHVIPVHFQEGRVLVEAIVDQRRVLLIVDSGAMVSVIDLNSLPKHGKADERTICTATGNKTAALLNGTIEFAEQSGKLAFQQKMLYGNFNFGYTKDGKRIGGLIGLDLLSTYASVSFDFQHQTMTLTEYGAT